MQRHRSPLAMTPLIPWIGLASMLVPPLAAQTSLAVGEVESYLALPVGHHPEGIAFDRDGNLYFGNRIFVPGEGFDSQLRKITPDGQSDTVIATFARSPKNALLGLAVDRDGNVWCAMHGGADHGVWRVSGNGKNRNRVTGSELIDFPNALTFDARGNLYVSDSGPVVSPVGGAIWRIRDGMCELWSNDPALAPFPFNPFGLTMPGANGIAFVPPDSLYVANTEKSQILRIPILADGSAGPLEAVTAPFTVIAVDGIAADVDGNLHCVLAGSLVVNTPPLVRVDTTTGAVSRTTLPAFDDLFDIGLSVVFGTLPSERSILWVTAGDNDSVNPALPPVGLGPRLLRTNVGVNGPPLGF